MRGLKKNYFLLFTLFFYLGLLPTCLVAQKKVLPFHQLTEADNLSSQKYNYYIFEDSEGYVWISSVNGLNRFDGLEVKQFHPDEKDDRALASGSIQGKFFEDINTNIWFGTKMGVHCYERSSGAFKKYKLTDEGIGSETYKVLYLEQNQKDLWVSYGDDLYKIGVDHPDSFQFVMNYRVLDNTCFVEEDHLITIYNPLNEGRGIGKLSLQNDSQFEIVTNKTLAPDIFAKALLYEDEQHLWVAGPQGLFVIDTKNNTRKQATHFREGRIESICSINYFSDEELLVGTRSEEEGLYLLNKEKLIFTDQIYSSLDNKVQPLMLPIDGVNVSSSDVIWISSEGSGVFYTKPSHMKMQAYLQNYEGTFIANSNVIGVAEDKLGNLWCLTAGGIVVINKLGQINPKYDHWHKKPPPFFKDDTYSIFIDADNRVWVFSYRGLFVLNDAEKKGVFKEVKSAKGSSLGRVPDGIVLNNSDLLLSTFDPPDSLPCGLFRIVEDGTFFKVQNVITTPSLEDVNYIFEDQSGAVYLCRYSNQIIKGHLRGDQFITDTTFKLGGMVTGMLEIEEKGEIWITSSSGLYKIEDENGEYKIKKNESFQVRNLQGVLYDDVTNSLWISSTSGLYSFTTESNRYRRYTSYDGLQSPEFNFYSAFKTSTGLLAFGGVNGINTFDPSKVLALPDVVPIPKITEIKVNDEPDSTLRCTISKTSNISQFESLVLPYKKNTLSFSFSAMDYSDPASNRFKFKMEGVDETDVNLESGNFARYPNLPIGKHTFLVKASSTNGTWLDDKTTRLKIEILPPWYWTWWAKIMWFLIGISLIYGAYRLRVNQIKKEAALKQKETELKQLAAETETAVLRLQMNPHFIFNSMNSISSYISERDVDTANAYLNRFAKLMRLILKLGKQPLIPVADEIDLLDQYMKTETMRFERKFAYDFDVSPEVDEDETLVPTMILQPFIENAIWHGLSGLQRKGQIKVRFWIESKTLLISITDNGVGREAAKVRKGVGTHKSQALEITRRRLQLLGEKEGQTSDFHFDDVLDSKGQVAGTKVTLRLPIL